MEAKIAKLKTQLIVACDQITRLQAFVDENGRKSNSQQLELRLRFLDKYFENYCEIQGQLESLVPEEVQSTSRADMETIYFDLKPQISVLIQGLRPSSLDSSTVNVEQSTKFSSSLKLRKIEIPIFNGDYAKWMEFHESFMSLVHNQENVDNIIKFQYLRSSLGKIPYRTIESLELTAANYAIALQLLSDRYENKKIICQDHIRSLFWLKAIDKGSAEKIREIIDHFNSHLRALESLQRPVKQWDDLIVTMMYNKLDSETRVKWDDESPPDRMATLDELMTFLNRRCHTLESKPSLPASRAAPASSRQTKQSSYISTRPQYKCVFCSTMGHSIFRCTKFLSLLPAVRCQEAIKRNICINCLKNDHTTAECSSIDLCKHCNSKHHTLLHQGAISANKDAPSTSAIAALNIRVQTEPLQTNKSTFQTTQATATLQCNTDSQPSSLVSSTHSTSYVFLATAVVKVLDKSNVWVSCRALLDSASQLFITDSFASRLGLKKSDIRTPITGIGDSTIFSAWKTNVILQSCHSSYTTTMDAHVLPSITGMQPVTRMKIDDWPIPANIPLADRQFNISQKIAMLIGAELYLELLSVGQIKVADHLPYLQNTLLGWIVSGKFTANLTFKLYCNVAANVELDLNAQLDRFFKQEINEYQDHVRRTPQEEESEAHYRATFQRTTTGRFRVRLPFSSPVNSLGESKLMAQRRFLSLEKTLDRNSSLKLPYVEFMNDYKSREHMTLVHENDIKSPNYFMPHHCVLKPDSSSTRLRVVFDASAPTTSGMSLNNILMVGPVIQNDLFSILRYPRYVFSTDISKMYRQIQVNDNDTQFPYIVWRNNTASPLQIYRLTNVTYGTAAAPFIATRCLKQLAIDEGKKYPLAAVIINNSIYVDDCLVGFVDLDTILQAKAQLINMLDTAGMRLHKWCANDSSILHDIPDADRKKPLIFDECEPEKTLGMYWEPRGDEFWFHVNLAQIKRITKRTVISDVARIFNPLGLIAPVILTGKIFLQQLWQLRIGWDHFLSNYIHNGFTTD